MPVNINDLSALDRLKAGLGERNVSESVVRAIEMAVKRGTAFGGEADLRLIDMPAADLATINSFVVFGPRITVVPNIKTVRYKVLPVDEARPLYGHQLIVGMPDRGGIAVEEAFPIGEDGLVVVDYDLARLPADGIVELRAKSPDGAYAALKRDGTDGDAADQIDVKISDLADATLRVVAEPIAASENPKIAASYPVRGRLIARDGLSKLDGYQIVLFAAGGDGTGDTDFVPVGTAISESNGYFVTAALLFPRAEDLLRVTAAKARVSKEGFSAELPIRLLTTDGDTPTSRIPDRVILVLEGSDEATEADKDACGCGDLKFLERKALEEFSYYTVVRTSEPSIIADVVEDEPDINLQEIYGVPGFVPLSVFRKYQEIQARQPLSALGAKAVAAEVGDRPTMLAAAARSAVPAGAVGTSGAAGLTGLRSSLAINTDLLERLVADHRASIVVKGNAKPRFRGRSHLGPTNQIDWDDTPTIYQAASIAHGHLLHFKQEWVPDGYSLGDIVYSLPLAPGQKKQIAVLDWERRESAAKSQSLDYEEALSNTLVRDRDISEVVSGTLTENLRANSKATTSGWGFGLGGAVMGVFTGGAYGALLGISGGKSTAGSNASQSGRREMTSNSLQSITDRTQQAASVVRSQRATVVQTVTQGERVQASAESVANYNHCHAITVQYFEVLRHFAVRNRLAGVQECLFIPLQMTRFDPAKCLRWRSSLERNLFRPGLLPGFDAIARIQNERESALENYYDSIGYPRHRYAEQAIRDLSGELFFEFFFFNVNAAKVDDAIVSFFSLFGISLDHFRDRQITDTELAEHVGPRTIESLLDAFVIRTDKGIDLKLDLTLNSRFRQSTPLRVSVRRSAQTPQVARESIEAVIVSLDTAKLPQGIGADMAQFSKYMKVRLRSGTLRYRSDNLAETLFSGRIDNDVFASGDAAYLPTPLNPHELRNPRGEDVQAANDLIHHLNENLEFYNARLFLDFTPERRFMLLDGMIAPGKANGRSVASVVENRVIGIAGNSLIMPVAPGYQLDPTIDDTFDMFAQYYDDPPEPMRVSMPTKGVYAEAVMGQCNSCEEKDESRFWRWQESPIPDSPNTQILPLGTDTRRSDPGTLDPKDMPTPVVNIQNAPNLPDPAGLQALITALGRNDAFRDLTGLNQNQLNAAAAYSKALDTAQSFGQDAAGLAKTAAMIDLIKNAKDSGNLSKEQAQDKSDKVLDGATPPTTQQKIENAQKKLEMLKKAFETGNIDGTQLNALSEGALKDTMPGASDALTPNDVSRIARDANTNMADVDYKGAGGDLSIKPFKGLGAEVMLASYSNAAKLKALSDWKQLLLFKVPDAIVSDLTGRSMKVQYAHNESFSNDLNFDMYRFRIAQFPTIDGQLMTPETLIKYIRMHINDYYGADFTPYEAAVDKARWESDDPLGAVMEIDIPGPDNASVVVSATTPSGWRFSTVQTPRTGDHPVSGHRDFFIQRDSADRYFYFVIKGLDMSSTGIAGAGLPLLGEHLVYSSGDDMFSGSSKAIMDMVNANGGIGTRHAKVSERVEWQMVYREWKDNLEMTFGPGAGSPENSSFFDFDLF